MISFALTNNIAQSTPQNATTEEKAQINSFNNHLNDLYMLENGQLATVDGAYDILQSIKCAILLWIGEYDFDTQLGVPYKIILGNPGSNGALIEFQIRRAIFSVNDAMTTEQLAIFGIDKIQSLNFSFNQTTRGVILQAVLLLNNRSRIEVNI